MNLFTFTVAESPAAAVEAMQHANAKDSRLIAGGTNLLDLMKETVENPRHLIDINHLGLNSLKEGPERTVTLGALMTNADTAYHPVVVKRYPLLSKAILAGASPQLRNMATNGGNLLQRTRCYYFYDTATPCNKREPGSGCPAMHGLNRMHAILGASRQCIAVHPSDFCVALAALEAVIHVTSSQGSRTIPIADFHRLPGDEPQRDTNLQPGELITGIELPAEGFAHHYAYLKIRDRQSYAFALVSCAAGLAMENGLITQVRIALGGVASKPWRIPAAEGLLIGEKPSASTFAAVADALLAGAEGHGHNDFKIPLAKRVIIRALEEAAIM